MIRVTTTSTGMFRLSGGLILFKYKSQTNNMTRLTSTIRSYGFRYTFRGVASIFVYLLAFVGYL